MSEPITRADYMQNHHLHEEYYAQFETVSTRSFIEVHIGLDKLLQSKDRYFNDVVRHVGNSWIWDYTPVNLELALLLGEWDTSSLRTCVGKAVARLMVTEHNQEEELNDE